MFEEEIKNMLEKATGLKDISLEVPSNPDFGDFAFPCFQLSKIKKKNPVEIAKDLASKIKKDKIIKEAKAVGPYLNIFINKETLAEKILSKILKEKEQYGIKLGKKEKTQKILIEYPGPNTNKPLHLGHVRNMCLGSSLKNLLESQGNKVIAVNINNDRGVHICKSMLAYMKWGNNKTPESENIKPDLFVGNYYVKFAQEAKKHPELEDEANALLKKWEEGDKEVISVWKKMNSWAYQGFKETYKKFGVEFEKEYYESNIYMKGKDVVIKGLKDKIFQKGKEGEIFADLEKEGYDKKILLRSDGTSVYMTQDIYLAKERYDDFKFDKMIYVVGNEQDYHFKILFEIFKKLKYPFAENCEHFSYGMVNLTTGKMKSREGTVVDADALVNNIFTLAFESIKNRHEKISKTSAEERASKIAIASIKFYMLKHDPLKDFVFDPEKSISFEGETGPYVQYTYARINSIIKKSQTKISKDGDVSLLKEESEKNIIRKLSEYPSVLEKSAEKEKISLLAHYLLELSQEFNTYYHSTQIIQDNKHIEKARIMLIHCVKEVIKNGLVIMGIETLEEM